MQTRTPDPTEITYADYEAAVLDYIACMKKEGLEVTDPTPVAGQQLRFIASAPGMTAAESGRLDKISFECFSPKIRSVYEAWLRKTAPSEAELSEARKALAACLRDAGEEVPESPSTEDFVRLQQTAAAFGECSRKVGDEYGIPNFGG